MKHKIYLRILFLFLILTNFVVIFCFSSEEGKKSTYTSGKIAEKIVNTFSNTQVLEANQKQKQIKNWQPIVRKTAHFLIYTTAGIWIMSLFCTYPIKNIKKIVFTIAVGIIYAISDEIHQSFIPRKNFLDNGCYYRYNRGDIRKFGSNGYPLLWEKNKEIET